MVPVRSVGSKRILRAAIDALVDEFLPCEFERLEPRGDGLELIADVDVNSLARRDAVSQERQRLSMGDDVVAMAQAIREHDSLSNARRASRCSVVSVRYA